MFALPLLPSNFTAIAPPRMRRVLLVGTSLVGAEKELLVMKSDTVTIRGMGLGGFAVDLDFPTGVNGRIRS